MLLYTVMTMHILTQGISRFTHYDTRCEQMNGIPPTSRRVYQHMDLVLVLVTCACADLGSYLQGQYHSNTVREATFSDPFERWFASEMQLYLTACCLVGYRRYTLHLLAVAVIQINSFLMTLRRKNVAPQFVLTACYTLMLVGSFVTISYDDFFSHRTGAAGTGTFVLERSVCYERIHGTQS
jgi:hypothetical protein